VADLSIVVASVSRVNGGMFQGNAGATITAGQVCYLDAVTGLLKLAQSDGTLAEATVRGIALHASLTGQPLDIQTDGAIIIGGTVVIGGVYVLSAAAGNLCPVADIAPTNFVTLLGIAISATQIQLGIVNSGIQHA